MQLYYILEQDFYLEKASLMPEGKCPLEIKITAIQNALGVKEALRNAHQNSDLHPACSIYVAGQFSKKEKVIHHTTG